MSFLPRLTPLFLLTSCLGGGPGADRATDPTSVQSHTLTGYVTDYVSDRPLASVRVSAGDGSTLTDAAGTFSLTYHGGEQVTVTFKRFAFLTVTYTSQLHLDQRLTLALIPLAPIADGCVRRNDTVFARVHDLQGRKTILRRQVSSALVLGTGFRDSIPSSGWFWSPVDAVTYQVAVATRHPVVNEVDWLISDEDGYVYPHSCRTDSLTTGQ